MMRRIERSRTVRLPATRLLQAGRSSADVEPSPRRHFDVDPEASGRLLPRHLHPPPLRSPEKTRRRFRGMQSAPVGLPLRAGAGPSKNRVHHLTPVALGAARLLRKRDSGFSGCRSAARRDAATLWSNPRESSRCESRPKQKTKTRRKQRALGISLPTECRIRGGRSGGEEFFDDLIDQGRELCGDG